MTRRHVKVIKHCVLCGDTPVDRGFESTSDYEPDDSWQIHVLRFLREPVYLDGPVDYTTEKRLTEPAALMDPRIFRIHANRADQAFLYDEYNKFMDENRLQACMAGQVCTSCDPEYTTNVVHVQCWKLARRSFPGLSAVDLVQLARLTRPLVTEKMVYFNGGATLPPPTRLSAYTDLCHETGLGRLLAQVQSRLPPELQQAIFQYTRGLFQSLARCLDTIHAYSCIGHYGSSVPDTTIHRPLQTGARLKHIGLNTVNILGETCIAMAGSGGSRNWHEDLILPATLQATGIQAAYGTYGLVAMRILYADGSTSSWLGGASSSRRYFRTCRGKLEDMRIVHDGFKIIGVELRSKSGNNTTSSPGILWTDDEQPAPGRTYALLDAYLSDSHIMGNPDIRVGLYLSLKGIRSLTAFCTGKGICSIQTNGDVSRRIGIFDEFAVPITFFFSSGEYIASIRSLSRGRAEQISFGPFLVMITSTGRKLYFGAQHMMFYTLYMADISRFDQREGKPRRPVGLFVDPTTAVLALHSVGVALEEADEHDAGDTEIVLPGTNSSDSRYFPRFHWQGSFLSKASMANVRRLKVQYKRRRCRGMYIEYHGDRDEAAVLGQWDPALDRHAEVIYDADVAGTPPLQELTFVSSYEPFANGRSCIEILPERREFSKSPTYVHDDLTKDIAWWFTDDHDFVESWQGSMFTITHTHGNEIPAIMVDEMPESTSLLRQMMRPFG